MVNDLPEDIKEERVIDDLPEDVLDDVVVGDLPEDVIQPCKPAHKIDTYLDASEQVLKYIDINMDESTLN